MLNVMRTGLLTTLLCTAGLASTSVAQNVTDALDFVPADAAVVISTANLKQTHGRMTAWARNLNLTDAMEGLSMAQILLANQGLNATGPAVVVMPDAEGMNQPEGPQVVMILPIADFEQFVFGLGGEAVEGINEIVAPFGTVYAMPLGKNFAALSTQQELLDMVDADGGNSDGHRDLAGKTGSSLSSSNDLLVSANVQELSDSIRTALTGMKEQIGMAAAMGGVQGDQMATFTTLIDEVSTGFLRDGLSGMLGINLAEQGLGIDLGANFQEGSEVAGFFSNKGTPGEYLQKLPSSPFLFAMAMDYSGEGVRTLFNNLNKLNPEGGGMMGGADFTQLINDSKGSATLIGTTPGLFSGGLFANAMTFTAADNADDLSDAMRALYADMDGAVSGGIEMETSYEVNALNINGVDLDSYAVNMRVDPNDPNAMQAQMALQQSMMLMGGSGPQGYITKTDGGVYQTLSRNSELMGKALKLDSNLGAHAGIASVAEQLPANRLAEGYVDVGEVIKMVGSFAAMMGAEIPELKGEMPPVAMGLSGSDGGMRFKIYVPSQVISSVKDAVQAMEAAEGDFGDDEGGEGAGRPRF